MNAIELCQLLLNTSHCLIQEIVVDKDRLCLTLESLSESARCPTCSQKSSRLHSIYLRFPKDLAWAEWPVILHLKVKRFFCQNPDCPKSTFAEQFPDLVARYARRTERCFHRQLCLGVNVCARMAEKLLAQEQNGISDSSLNRDLRHLPTAEIPSIRVLGVDDWAKRKGQRYGTILVDLEQGEIVDLLGDRTAETLAAWLKHHPEIEIVSRDRSQTYAEAITKAAPQAEQVADRWHLLKNASEALFKILQQEHSLLQKYLNPPSKTTQVGTEDVKTARRDPDLTPAEQRRQERIELAQQLHGQGWSQKRIAQKINIHPKTVRRYLRFSCAKTKRLQKGRLIDPFRPYLLQRWNEGCHNATQLLREIQPQGFEGHQTIVLDAIRQFRKASGLAPKVRQAVTKPLPADLLRQPPSLRALAYFVFQRPENRSIEHEKLISQIGSEQLKLGSAIDLARSFAAMVRQRQVDELDGWLAQAEQSQYRIWKNFAAGLKQDEKAVRAALKYAWSNGPTEGHINRLKCLKRLMYGRAKDDLLRQRVLWQGKWGFT
jgi:transposase